MKKTVLFSLLLTLVLSAQVLGATCCSAADVQTGGGTISLTKRPSTAKINATPSNASTNATNRARANANVKTVANSKALPKAGAEENILIALLVAGAVAIAKKKYMA